MASAPTSRLGFLDSRGNPIALPREWERGYVSIDMPVDAWHEITLRRNGVRLDILARELEGVPRVVAEWPFSGTGHYQLELTHVGASEKRQITIWPRKISKSNYLQLLDDLEQLPPAIAMAMQQAGALAGIKLPPPKETTLASELQRLRRAVEGTNTRPGLAQILRSLAPDPYVVLQSTELVLPREQVRRIHPTRLAQAYATGHNLDADGHPERLPETRVEHTPDVYENRLVRAYHDQVNQRLRRLHVRLRTSHTSAAIVDELEQLQRALTCGRREATFLDEVSSPRQLPTQLTMVLLRRPDYRAALEGSLEFRRTVSIHLDEPALDAPLENLPSLYETWGTLQIIKALADTATELGYIVTEQLFRRDRSGLFLKVLRNGRPAVVLRNASTGTSVKLVPQRTYSPKATGLASASYPQTPDIAIEIDEPGRPARVLLFDPKYKLESEEIEGEITDGRPKKVDIDKMHAYRDAIRDQNDQRAVEYAAIIYPGAATEQFGKGLQALSARPGAHDSELQDAVRTVLETALASAGQALQATA